MEFVRSVLASDVTVVASTRVTYDLPVNPLSHVLFTLLCLNETSTITNYKVIKSLLDQVSNVAVEFKGTSIVNMSFADLAAYSMLITGNPLGQVNMVRTDNDARGVTVCIPFGRRLYDPNECFPAVRKGDLRLVIDYAAAQTGLDTVKCQIETVELLGAEPKQFLKCTTISKTPTATGDLDVDLPIGNNILGVVLFGTTVPNTDYTATINRVKCKVDNVEYGYSESNWESLHGEMWGRIPYNDMVNKHVHYYDGSEVGAATTLGQENDVGWLDNYVFLDFDPLGDGQFALVTEGKARVHLVINAGDTNALRVLPVELLGVGGE